MYCNISEFYQPVNIRRGYCLYEFLTGFLDLIFESSLHFILYLVFTNDSGYDVFSRNEHGFSFSEIKCHVIFLTPFI